MFLAEKGPIVYICFHKSEDWGSNIYMYILQDYIYQLSKAPPELADNKDTIFINSEDIFFFHKVYVNHICIYCATVETNVALKTRFNLLILWMLISSKQWKILFLRIVDESQSIGK